MWTYIINTEHVCCLTSPELLHVCSLCLHICVCVCVCWLLKGINTVYFYFGYVCVVSASVSTWFFFIFSIHIKSSNLSGCKKPQDENTSIHASVGILAVRWSSGFKYIASRERHKHNAKCVLEEQLCCKTIYKQFWSSSSSSQEWMLEQIYLQIWPWEIAYVRELRHTTEEEKKHQNNFLNELWKRVKFGWPWNLNVLLAKLEFLSRSDNCSLKMPT